MLGKNRLVLLLLPVVLAIASAAHAQTAAWPDAAPVPIDIANAPAPLFDDPVTHGGTDPFVIWNPVKSQWFMYYTQRRSTLPNANGVDWVHGSAIGIATSPDGVHWTYLGTCRGDHDLSDPLAAKGAGPEPGITWWAPCFLREGNRFHMWVVLVDGVYTNWTGKRNILHFTSDDGITWKYLSTAQLSSNRVIDPTVYRVGDLWYMVYKDEAKGSHTFVSQSPDLENWSNAHQAGPDGSQEAPFVFRWRDKWWLMVDALGGRGLRIYTSDNGVDGFKFSATILGKRDGTRPHDQTVGHHPGIVIQGPPGIEQCIVYYFTESNRHAYMQIAELELDADGKPFCNRNKYAPATQPATSVQRPDQLPPPAQDPNRPAAITQNPTRPNSWSDAQGRAYQRSSWGTWTNYDESKASPYPLPDPLILKNGRPVVDADIWWNQRRPEILEDFRNDMYGRIPDGTPKVTWHVTATDAHAAGGLAMKKTVVGHIDNSRYPRVHPSINITMYTPSNAAGPVPMIVVVIAGPGGYGAPRPGTPARQPEPPPGSPLYQLLAIGWGYATMEVGPIQNDYSGGLTSGIIGLMSEGKPRNPDDWGALTAWTWGLSRAMDYFETDKSVDARQLGVEGHSRYGKTALLAAALDQRWAIVFASCSGEGGAKPSRRNWGETLDNVATSHWFAVNFRKYAGGHWNDLPVDSHELIALVAPRPIFLNGGTGDAWADPHGAFLAAVAAGPVYRLLGRQDLGSREMPTADTALVSGDMAFRYHQGGHTDAPDWPAFLKFAQRYLKAPG